MRRTPRHLLHGAAALAFLVAAIDPAWGPLRREAERWILLDVSASAVRGRADRYGDLRRLLAPALDPLEGGDRAGILAFARAPLWILPPSEDPRRRCPPSLAAVARIPDATATNLEAALEVALRLAPRGADVVLVTDGIETEGAAERLAEACVARDLVVHGIRLGAAAGDDAAVEGIRVPERARAGERVRARAVVRADLESPERATVRWRIVSGESTLDRGAVLLLAGSRTVEDEVEFTAPGSGTYRVEARVSLPGGSDLHPENDVAGGGGRVEGTVRVGTLGDFGGALEGVPGVAASPLSPTNGLVEALGRVEILALSGGLASASDATLERVVEAVEGGALGLLFAAAEEWDATRGLEPVLPLRPRAPEDSGSDVLVLLDASGSMEGEKFEAARESALRLAEAAGERDALHVAAFAEAPEEVRALRPPGARSVDPEVAAFLAAAVPRGNTDLFRAVRGGADFLGSLPRGDAARPRRRRLFVLTDGRHESGPADVAGAAAAIGRVEAEAAFFAVGSDADLGLLRALAEAAGGAVREVEDPERLADALRREEQGGRIRHGRESARRGTGRWATSFPEVAPPILARARCVPREGAEPIYGFDDGEALLAVWNVGLGRAAAVASRLGSADAPDWRGEKEIWRRLLDLLAPAPRDVEARVEDESLVVEAREDPGDASEWVAKVAGLEMRLARVGSRRFEGKLPAGVPFAALVEVEVPGGETRPAGVVHRRPSAEFSGWKGQDVGSALAAATGGIVFEAASDRSLPRPAGGSERAGVRLQAAAAGALLLLGMAAARALKGRGRPAD